MAAVQVHEPHLHPKDNSRSIVSSTSCACAHPHMPQDRSSVAHQAAAVQVLERLSDIERDFEQQPQPRLVRAPLMEQPAL